MEMWIEDMLEGMELIRRACASVDDSRCKDCPFKKACDRLDANTQVGTLLDEYDKKHYL